MMVSCQISIYPLGVEELGPAIEAAVAELREAGLEPEVGPMATYVTGDEDAVFEGLRRAFAAAAREGHVVMTLTVSNACPLP
ncbi:MAG: YkoF family thiamine/hydroxymethylpyrimidine-binding protein [Alphaproteobacteria bacterium]